MANAMKPLPESQDSAGYIDSQLLTEDHVESKALPRHNGFSRPEGSLDTAELTSGFTFGKPVPIRPGQFTGQAMPKCHASQFTGESSNLAEQDVAGEEKHIPESLVTHDSHDMTLHISPARSVDAAKDLKAPPELPHLNDGSSSPTEDRPVVACSLESSDIKPLEKPIVGYEPISRPRAPAPSKEQVSTQVHSQGEPAPPHPPQSVAPEFLRETNQATSNRLESKQRSATKHKKPHDPSSLALQSENVAQFMSRGDLSSGSSSAQSSDQHHQRHPRRQNQQLAMTRPMRRENMQQNVATPPRQIVYTSNTSRKATPSQASTTSTYRVDSAIRKFDSSMLNQTRSEEKYRRQMAVHYADLMNEAMSKPRGEGEQVTEARKKLIGIAKDQKQRINQYKADAKARDEQIEQLSEQCDVLKQQLDDKSSELEDRSSGLRELEEKCRRYKDFLNDAIKEQQKLYKASKQQMKDAVDKLRAEQLQSTALDQQQKAKAEAAQDHMRQRVANAIAETKRLELDFRGKLQGVEQQLGDRNSELARDKETIKELLQRLAEQQVCQDELKEIQSQTSTISKKLVDFETRQKEQKVASDEGQAATLSVIVDRLDNLMKEVKSQPDTFPEWVVGNNQTTSRILAQLESVASAQSETTEKAHQLAQQLDGHMRDVWKCLAESKASLRQELEGKILENLLLSTTVEDKEVEIQDLFSALKEASEHALQGENQIQELEAKILQLENSPRDDPDVLRQLQALREEKNNLKEELASKSSLNSKLQVSLQQKDQEIAAEIQNHKEDALEFIRLLGERENAAQKARDQAVDLAVREVSASMEQTKQDFQRRVNEAESDRDKLAKELDDAKRMISELREKDCCEAEAIRTLRSDLANAESRASTIVEDEKKRLAENAEMNKHNESTISQLKQDLIQAEQNLAKLTEDSQVYEREAQDLINDLKQWTKVEHGIGKSESQLQSNDDQGEHVVKIPRFQKLRELQMMHKTIIHHYGTQKDDSKKAQTSVMSQPRIQKLVDQAGVTPDVQTSTEHTNREEPMPLSGLLNAGIINPDLLDRNRRVILQSPAVDLILPTPPSIAQEKERRREGGRPKGIMRTSDGVPIIEDDSERRRLLQMSEIPGSGIFSRGIHSQMVTGNGLNSGSSAGTQCKKKPFPANRDRISESGGFVETNAKVINQSKSLPRKRISSTLDTTEHTKRLKTQLDAIEEPIAEPVLLRQTILEVDGPTSSRRKAIVNKSSTVNTSAIQMATPRVNKKIKLSDSQQSSIHNLSHASLSNPPSESRTSSLRTYSSKDSDGSPRVLYPQSSDHRHRRSTSVVGDSQELNVLQ